MTEDARTFWASIIAPNGVLDEEQVHNELHDYWHMLQEVPRVYEYITCGRMSKPLYYAHDVLSVADECTEKFIREAVTEALQRVKAGERVDDVLEEFK